MILVALALSTLTGLAAGLGSPMLMMLVASLAFGPWILLMPTTWMIGLLVFMATIGFGSLQYFGRVHQAHWIPTLLLVALLFRSAFDALQIQSRRTTAAFFNPLALAILAFIALVAVSALLNRSDPMQTLVGCRHYIFPFVLVLAVLNVDASRRYWIKLLRAVPWLVLLQLPLCIYQYFFVEKARGAKVFGAVGIAWDAVVGSFGGNPEGGGASGALAVFVSFGIATTVVLWRRQLISRRLALVTIGAAAVCSALAEIKVIVVFLPLALLLVNRQRVLRSPVSFVIWALTAVLLAAALMLVYQRLHYGDVSKSRHETTLAERFERLSRDERDTGFYNPLTGEVSRVGGLLLWSEANISRDLGPKALIGWGPAASKFSTLFGMGPAARSHQFSLTTSSATQLLWDLGLGGLLLFTAICALGISGGLREAKRLGARSAELGSVAEISALGSLLVLAGILYNGDAVNSPSVQILLSLCLGLVLWLRRQPPDSDPAAGPTSGPAR